jgi:hypothetical protein
MKLKSRGLLKRIVKLLFWFVFTGARDETQAFKLVKLSAIELCPNLEFL